MCNKKFEIIVVSGFNHATDVPIAYADSKSFYRKALVFSPFLNLCKDNDFIQSVICHLADILKYFYDYLKCNDILIYHNDRISFSNLQEYFMWLEEIKNSENNFDAPCEIRFYKNRILICIMVTEFWCRCGGSYPYSDSFTFSFYTNNRFIKDTVSTAIYNALASSRCFVKEEILESSHPLSRIEQGIYQIKQNWKEWIICLIGAFLLILLCLLF